MLHDEAKKLTGRFSSCDKISHECKVKFICDKHYNTWHLQKYERYKSILKECHRLSLREKKIYQDNSRLEAQIAIAEEELKMFNSQNMRSRDEIKELKEKQNLLRKQISDKKRELSRMKSRLQVMENYH